MTSSAIFTMKGAGNLKNKNLLSKPNNAFSGEKDTKNDKERVKILKTKTKQLQQ